MEAQTIEARKQRGQMIAQTCRITRSPKGDFLVPSQSGRGRYVVRYEDRSPFCNCPDFEQRGVLGIKCKHIWAVEITVNKHLNREGVPVATKTLRVTYQQDWNAYNNAQVNEKELFMKMVYDLCQEIPNSVQTFGRPKLPMSDMIFASALKVYTTFSLRRFESDMRAAMEDGYVNSTPCFASVGHFIQRSDLTPILIEMITKTALPLASVETDFAVDSSGFTTKRYARWHDFKYGRGKDVRVWLKAHLMCGIKTNIVTAAEITEGYSNDTQYLPQLVNATKLNFDIREVSADKAYSSKNNVETIVEAGGTPYIPFKKNMVARARTPRLWKKLFHYFQLQREDFLQHYHKRSNVETTFHMIKSKFGTQIRSKSKNAEINEVLLKILCHNISVVIQEMYERGIEANFCVRSGGDV